MKKIVYALSIMIVSLTIVSCGGSKNYRSSSLYGSPETENVEVEEVKKPQKTKGFYERLLEDFCKRFYKDCFENIDYKENSLRIKDISFEDSKAYIQGVHSYRGWGSHKDVDFTAVVEEKEDDYYEVFFAKDVEYLFDDKNGREAATRNMWYKE